MNIKSGLSLLALFQLFEIVAVIVSSGLGPAELTYSVWIGALILLCLCSAFEDLKRPVKGSFHRLHAWIFAALVGLVIAVSLFLPLCLGSAHSPSSSELAMGALSIFWPTLAAKLLVTWARSNDALAVRAI